jgi:hypothetical protein
VAALDELRRIKWFLWHGNTYRPREATDDLVLDLEALDSRYPNRRRLRTTIRAFQLYITRNEASLINYGERYRSGERTSSAFVEATANAVISKPLPRSSRCNGVGAGRTCFCRREPERWMAHCVPHSNTGTSA